MDPNKSMQAFKSNGWTTIEVIIIVLVTLVIGFHAGRYYENRHNEKKAALYREAIFIAKHATFIQAAKQVNAIMKNRRQEFCKTAFSFRASEWGVAIDYY